MKKKFTIYLFSTMALLFAFSSINLEAQSQSDTKKPIKYKKARALQTSTAKKMAKVYEALEEVDDAGEPKPDMETVLSVLTELRNNKDELKSYDRSVMWNAWAYVYMTDGKYPQAMDAYTKLMNEPEVTIGLRNGAILALAQLNLAQENYQKGIQLILQWMDEVDKVTAQSWSLLGQAYFAINNYRKSMSSLETAISLAEEEGYKPRESWYQLLAGCISELKEEIGEKESLLRQRDIF